MSLPFYLEYIIEKKLNNKKISELLTNRQNLTENYKEIKNNNDPIKSEADFLTYLLSRLPCTYEVAYKIFSLFKEYEIESMLDIGAGPATLAYAGLEQFSSLNKITLLERNKYFIQFINEVSNEFPENITLNVKNEDIERNISLEKHDLVTISYVLNELKKETMLSLIGNLWNATNKVLVIIEPGTPRGFNNIKLIRDILITKGAYVLAPCTHNLTCPMKDNDWCHFFKRVERSKYQKYLKAGKESFEDEKFSYLILSKKTFEHLSNIGRVLRFPKHNKANSEFNICSVNGVERVNITNKNVHYKIVKKLTWGDLLIQE